MIPKKLLIFKLIFNISTGYLVSTEIKFHSNESVQTVFTEFQLEQSVTLPRGSQLVVDEQSIGRVYGTNRKQLLVLTDRKTRYTKLEKMGTGYSQQVAQLTKNILMKPQKRVITVTNDK